MATFTADMERLTKDLIQTMTGFEPSDENFKLCYKFAKSNFVFHRYLNADELKVSRSIHGLSEKFSIQCQTEKAESLERLTEEFLNSSLERNFPKSSCHYGILQLLLCLSESPVHSKYVPSASVVEPTAPGDSFDWGSYLMEGLEYPSYDEVEDESLWRYPGDTAAKPSRASVTPRRVRPRGLAEQRECPPGVTSYEAHADKMDRLIGMASRDWLLHHVTTPYWELTLLPLHRCYSNKVTVPRETGLAWLEHRKLTDQLHVPREMTTVTEEQLIRETLWALLGAERSFVYELVSDRTSVREDLLVVDITPLALQNVLQHLAAVITPVRQLRHFIKLHTSLEGRSWKSASCETYKAFANSLLHYLEAFDGKLRQMEKGMVDKTSFISLLGLMAELQPSLRELQGVHDVFIRGTATTCSAKLLTCLWKTLCYYDILGLCSSFMSRFILPLWIMTLRPYMVMLDDWMRCGTLPDKHNEFCIQRNNQNVAVRGLAYWNDNFSFQELPAFLQPVKEQVMLAGKSMQLVESVGYLKQVEEEQEKLLEGHQCPLTLFEEFLQTVRAEVAKMSAGRPDRPVPSAGGATESAVGLMASVDPVPGPALDLIPDPAAGLIPDPIPALDLNPDLAAGLIQDPIPGPALDLIPDSLIPDSLIPDPIPDPASSGIELFDPRTIWKKDLLAKQFVSELLVHKETSLHKHHDPLWEELQLLAGCPLHKPLASILEGCLQSLVQKRYFRACSVVMRLLNTTYRLMEHFTAVRMFFLMEAGDVMYQFYADVFQKILSHEPWQHDSYLNAMFQEALQTRFCSPFGKDINVVCTEVSKEISMNILLSLSMEYEVQWPLNIIFNEEVMHTYNEVFRFLLQVKWAKWCLEGLRQRTDAWVALPPEFRHKVQLLHHLKSQLLHFINSLNNYLMTRILHSVGLEFQEDIAKAEDVDTVVSVHDKYVNTIFDRCLLNKKASYIKEAIMKILNLTLHFRQKWERGLEKFSTAEAEYVETEFTKCTHFLVSFLQKTVEKGSYPHLETLAFSLGALKQGGKIFGTRS